jgi:hypothetical protein
MCTFPLAEDAMPHNEYKVTSADPHDLAEAVAFALLFFEGRERTRDADAFRLLLPRNALYAIWTTPA